MPQTIQTLASWQRQLMGALMLAGLCFYVVMDFIMARTPGATISEISINLLYRHPVYAFILGAILGHITYPVVTTRPQWQTICLVACVVVTAILLDVSRRIPPVMPIIPLLLGLPFGHLVWPQRTVSMEHGLVEIETPAEITRIPASVARE